MSYRSVPRILNLFNLKTNIDINWIPHFSSVINWTLRVGLGKLNQVKPIVESWVAIIDHTIDIGTKKALVVLRVSMAVFLMREGAVRLEDCECVGLAICEKTTGEAISIDLEKIFAKSGLPDLIVKDADSSLQKGTRLHFEAVEKTLYTIDDIGHVMANALKAQFEKTTDYKKFMASIKSGASRLRQTSFAFVTPPKLRSKGRFQSISNLGKWGEKMLNILGVRGRSGKGSLLEKLRDVFPDLLKSRKFIETFASTTKIVSQVLKILKNKGLDKNTYKECYTLSKKLPRGSIVKKRLQAWLKKNKKIQKKVAPKMPILVSSDIIESLFGQFKYIMARSPQADMNRSALLIPALCGTLNSDVINEGLRQASQSDLKKWEEDNIPYTIRKRRQSLLNTSEDKIQKAGKFNTN